MNSFIEHEFWKIIVVGIVFVGAIIYVLVMFLLVVCPPFNRLAHRIVYAIKDTPPQLLEPEPAYPLNPPPPTEYSRIDLRRFAPYHAIPKEPNKPPYVPEMQWQFTDFPDDEGAENFVELWLALSESEYKLIRTFELNKEPLEDESLYDEDAIAAIQHAQEDELRRAEGDPAQIQRLKMEHKLQMDFVRKQTFGRTIEYYIQWPYRREFKTRRQAVEYMEKLDRKILPDFKRRLERYAQRS